MDNFHVIWALAVTANAQRAVHRMKDFVLVFTGFLPFGYFSVGRKMMGKRVKGRLNNMKRLRGSSLSN